MRGAQRRIALACVALVATFGGVASGQGAHRLQAIEDYLMDEGYEVALALSAGPEHVRDGAGVLVLRADGYEQVRESTNGFLCLVERSWSSPIGPHRDFFNPDLRAPICYNAEGARTILGDYLRRTGLALAGATIAEIGQAIATEIGDGTLRPPRGLAMSFMLSGGQLLGTNVGRFKPHVMFYVPYATSDDLGSPPPGTDHPVMFEHEGSSFAAIVVPVAKFNEPPPKPLR